MGEVHQFTVRVQRGGVKMEELWLANRVSPLTGVYRHEGRLADSIAGSRDLD